MASVTEVQTVARPEAPDWSRKYPPLLVILLALAVALFVLPSKFNLPQSNPTQTLEYAPVPPNDENPDVPPDGNLAAVGLGDSPSLEGEGADGGEGPGGGPPTTIKDQGFDPGSLCVGKPGRQTIDPLAPPCVNYFNGDNYGATYQGVTGEEINLLIYMDGGITYNQGSDATNRTSPTAKYFDLFQDPDPDAPEHFLVKGLRTWQKYFNERFQTYNRNVHFFVYFTDCASTGCTPEDRRADGADNFARVKPFAVVSFATEGAENDYLTFMAKKYVLNFGSFGLRPSEFFQSFPKLIWSFLPSVEQQAASYASYVCRKVVGKPASMAGPEYTGQKRKLGMISTSDPDEVGLRLMAQLVTQKVEACGGDVVMHEHFPNCCLAQDNGEVPAYAQRQMADFHSEDITTILWPGGINGNYGKTASTAGYVPEWIVLGDSLLDANNPIRLSQNTTAFDRHAIVVTPQVVEPALEQQLCYQTYREIDPEMPRSDLGFVCEFYQNLFQFFVGVQVAGPRLGPTSVDQGFHAIPQRQSGEPQVPACFYLPGDYTCVKDAEAEYWDAQGRAPGDDRPGCWRPIGDPKADLPPGSRYLADRWPDGNIDAQITGNEPCNGYNAGVRLNLA